MREYLFPYGLSVGLAGAPAVVALDSAGLAVPSFTPENGVRGARVFTGATLVDGETVTVVREDASTEVYTAKTTLTPTAGEFLLGVSETTALVNLGFAISGGGTTTEVAAGTEPCLEYDVASDATTLTLTALNFGDYLNTAIAAFAETGGGSWAAATSGVDTPDFKEAIDYGSQANASAAPFQRNGVFPLCPYAAQLTAQVNHLEFDDNSGGGVFIRDDFLLATTDHPKAKYTRGCIYAGKISTPASDIVTGGLLIDIPINSSHSASGDWTGDDTTMPPATDDVIIGDWIELFNPATGFSELAQIKDFDADGGAANEARITLPTDGPLQNVSTLQGAGQLFYRIYRSNIEVTGDLATQAKADVNAEADTAISDYFGAPISDTINDGSASASSFTTTTDQSAKILLGICRLTSGAISGEARLCTWTGTTMTVHDPDSIPAGLETGGPFSAAPANAVTFAFLPLS